MSELDALFYGLMAVAFFLGTGLLFIGWRGPSE